MSAKPTYEELEQRVKELEKEALERKHAEESLAESEEKFRSIIERLPMGMHMYEMDSDGQLRFIDANPAADRILGIDNKLYIGKTIEEAFPEVSKTEIPGRFRAIAEEGGFWKSEDTLYEDDLIKGVFDCHSFQTIPGKMVSLFVDITERKQAAEVLRESERKLQIRNRIAEIFLTSPDEKMYGEVLEVVLEAMDSKYGTFAYIDEHGDRVVPSMTGEIWKKCQMLDKIISFPRDTWGNNLWARCLIEKKSVSSNGPFKVPDGHIAVARALAVPIIHKGEAIGNFMVGDKATDYDGEDKKLLESITDHVAPILHAILERIKLDKERKQAAEALRESEERYRALYDNAPAMYHTIDTKGIVLECNQTEADMLGYSKKEIIGKPIYTFQTEGYKDLASHALREAMENGNILGEIRFVRKDGTFIDTALDSTAIYDDSGQVIGFRSVLTDITHYKLAKDALQESEERYRTLFMNNPIETVVVDSEGKVTAYNKAREKRTKKRLQDRLPKVGDRMYTKDYAGKHRINMREELMSCIKSGKSKSFPELKYNGRFLDINIAPFTDGAIITSIDITERKQAEEKVKEYSERLKEMVKERTKELEEAQKELVRRERLTVLGQLAGGMGHELRNPLGAIRNSAYFLNMVLKEPEPRVKEALGILEKEIVTSERIISSLLDFSRPEAPKRLNVNISDIIDVVLSRISVPKNIEVVNQLDETLPTIPADPDQLNQAFGNLIVNAVQTMPEGGRLVIKSEAQSPEQVAVSIVDTGTGMDEETLGKVFEPLFTTKAKGLGIGLSFTRILVEAHGGTIKVQSKAGEGSTFTLFLPTRLRKKEAKILVVDDDKEIRDALTKALTTDRSYQTDEASNGTEALIKLGTYRPDLLLLDIFMPKMDGLEVCRTIKNNPELSKIKIIIITGHPNHPKLKEIAELGFTNIYAKPLKLKSLLKEVDKVLGIDD